MDYNSSFESTYKRLFLQAQELSLDILSPDEESLQNCSEYKQVFSAAESFLNKISPSQLERTPYFALRKFKYIIERNKQARVKNTWGKLASVFFLLNLYALRILRAPWRKSYGKIKTYSGSYHHVVCASFEPKVAEELMEKLGYIYSNPRQTYYFQQQSLTSGKNWQETLMRAGMDYFLLHVRCSLSSTELGKTMEVDISLPRKDHISAYEAYHAGIKDPKVAIKTRNFAAKDFNIATQGIATVPRSRTAFSEGRSNRVEKPHDLSYVPATRRKEVAAPTLPWKHRLPSQMSKVQEVPRVSRGQMLYSQSSEELEDIYNPKYSPPDSKIRYPPDLPFSPTAFGRETLRRLNQESERPSMSTNYVTVMPMNMSREASKYTDRPHSSRSSPGMEPAGTSSSTLNYFDISRSSGYAAVPSPGDYVHVVRPKRAPDTRSETPQHIYHEIQDKDLYAARIRCK